MAKDDRINDLHLVDPQTAAMDRAISRVPPPPMIVLHKGWWADRRTERSAADLEREDAARRGSA